MPTYEYVCEKCDKTFEVVQSIKEDPLTVCPKDRCGRKSWGKGKVKRAISLGGGLLFKGTGFYTTDYRSESYKQSAKNEGSATGSSTTPPPTPAKTEGTPKPEAKTTQPSKPAPSAA